MQHYMTSEKFLWTLWAIDAVRLVSLVAMVLWLCSPDKPSARGGLVFGHALNFLCTLACSAFAFLAVNAWKVDYFPRGLSKSGELYNTWIGAVNIIPAVFQAYYWYVAARFKR